MENLSERRRVPPHRLIRDFLPASAPAALLDWAIENEADFKPTTMGYGGLAKEEPTQRRSVGVHKFGPLEPVLRQRALEIAPALFDELRVSPSQVGSVELQLVAHNDGGFLKQHIDTFTGAAWAAASGSRVVSAVYYLHYLPKAFTGGCLRLFPFGATGEDGGYLDFEPEHNTLLVFPSWTSHEVLPIYCPSKKFADSRFAVNIWFRAPAPAANEGGG
jgi:Rps23 Pro-64 3,4-dihydroxylase Tpa1-like proline 4-hydroxylase